MRNHHDWIQAYVDYASFSEAPKRMHFWTGVSAIAGALRRRVWIDMAYFKWYPNHYVIFVAPPGIVSKSTTVAIGMDLLRKVPGINFGPDVVTWPALVTAFANSCEAFEFNHEYHEQCALTLESSEFGNLINPADRDMIDLLVTLWDSKQGQFKKITKGSGNDTVVNPWINLIACTTPAWIAGNFPAYVIGGGFTSRCIFVYAETKEKFIAYPSLSVPAALASQKVALIQDLEHIAVNLCGPYSLTSQAIAWGSAWYEQHYNSPPADLPKDQFGGYLARKQTHIHKLAMVLAAGQRDDLVIEDVDLALASQMISDLEADLPKVFANIGRSEESIQAERFIEYIRTHGPVPVSSAYQIIHARFPKVHDFEGILNGALRAGLIEMHSGPKGFVLMAPVRIVQDE
jgi:hypothetical protein